MIVPEVAFVVLMPHSNVQGPFTAATGALVR